MCFFHKVNSKAVRYRAIKSGWTCILYFVVTCGPRPVQQVVLYEPFDSHDLTQRRENLFGSTPETINQLVVFLFTVHLSSNTQRKEGGNFLVFLWFVISALCAFYCVSVLEHVYCQQVITLSMRFCQAGLIFRLLNFCVHK